MKRKRELSIVCYNKKYRFVGCIHEQSLHLLSLQGFNTYHEALTVLKQYGYTLWRG